MINFFGYGKVARCDSIFSPTICGNLSMDFPIIEAKAGMRCAVVVWQFYFFRR